MGKRCICFQYILTFLIILSSIEKLDASFQSCDRGKAVGRNYLMYDLNPAEGFNLRRDVYIRIAVLVKILQQYGDWVLVLPPWGPLPHWKSKNIGEQQQLPWKSFFEIESLAKYVPVLELSELLADKKRIIINQLVYLQHFQEAWDGGKWEEKYAFEECNQKTPYTRSSKNGPVKGWFWGYENIQANNFSCISFQGHYKKLLPILTDFSKKSSSNVFMLDRAEIPLHDDYGGINYWKVRRSMRFSSRLYSLAKQFRRDFLQSEDEADGTSVLSDWRDETVPSRETKGGNYICGHLRRQDFLYGRANDIPSLKSAAETLQTLAQTLDVPNIFIATDASKQEAVELRSYFSEEYHLVLYQPSFQTRREILDGGVAIVEQIICSRARHFIGSFESTFSFRIQEEREILGFSVNSTFNRFCSDGYDSCEQPAKWKIVM